MVDNIACISLTKQAAGNRDYKGNGGPWPRVDKVKTTKNINNRLSKNNKFVKELNEYTRKSIGCNNTMTSLIYCCDLKYQ